MIAAVSATALTFISLIISIVSYYLYYKSDNHDYLRIGRTAFYFSSILIFAQSAMLMWGILNHKFEWQYVFSYSSRDLSVYYLITTFWGGQEGTFLLWLSLGSIYGIVLIRKRSQDEPLIMSFMLLVQAFIAVILIKKNPFSYIWDINPANFPAGVIPVDGNGLNPLLQDPWMIIHPPVLFTGYSSTMMLFAFAMTALVKKDYSNWIKDVFPYALFVVLSLGTGIILGGYWAYTTLGWGGYWGWDPVENSSFIPWILSLAFIHGLLIQRNNGSLKKTNLFMALLTFVLVLYGSFLTRSGVLADFSVHSFSESAINNYLVAFLLLFSGISILAFLFRAGSVPRGNLTSALFSRDNFMFFGVLALLISGMLTFFGTSAPLFTGLFAAEAASVSVDYYNLLNTPVAIMIGFFIALSPVLSWKKSSGEKLKAIRVHAIAALISSGIAYFLGLQDIVLLVIFALFVFAILVNLQIVFRMVRSRKLGFGGYLSHVGIGFMMIGIITSSAYETIVKTTLPIGSAKNVLGYEMVYEGFRMGEKGKDEAVVSVKTAGFPLIEATPKFYWSEFNRAYMRNPSVHNLWLKDLYISPIQIIPPEQNMQGTALTMLKGQKSYYENYVLTFAGYEMKGHDSDSGKILVNAVLTIVYQGEQHVIKPAIQVLNHERRVIAANLPGDGPEVLISGVNVEEKSITFLIKEAQENETPGEEPAKELLAVEITEKPLINLLWIGTILMISGLVVAIVNRVHYKKL